MTDESGPRIRILKDGPYIVSGAVPLLKRWIACDEHGEATSWEGDESYTAQERYSLCRCGKSSNKPFCDGSHFAAGFDGAETASREPCADRWAVLEGPGLNVTDITDFCAEARFCAAFGGLWHLVERTDDPEVRETVIRQCFDCPSGRYVARDAETGEAIEPEFEPSIVVVEDPDLGVSGPLWARGGIPLQAVDGFIYEVRNGETVCRCGASKNKPFCDGTHREVGLADER